MKSPFRLAPVLAPLLAVTACANSTAPGAGSVTPYPEASGGRPPIIQVNEFVSLPRLPGWHVVTKGLMRSGGTITELVPSGETAQYWTEKVTSMVLAPRISARKVAEGTIGLYRSICRNVDILEQRDQTIADEQTAAGGPPNTYAVYDILVLCQDPNPAKAPPSLVLKRFEVTWFRALSGRFGDSLVQRAWHADHAGPGTITQPGPTRDAWRAWADQVRFSAAPPS